MGEQHAGVRAQGPLILFLCGPGSGLAVVLPLWNKVSANKGPFHELQAGPRTTTKEVTETGSQENSLLRAHGVVPTSTTQSMTTPSPWSGGGWKETVLFPLQGKDLGGESRSSPGGLLPGSGCPIRSFTWK